MAQTNKKAGQRGFSVKKKTSKKGLWLTVGGIALILALAVLLYFLVFIKEDRIDYKGYGMALAEIETRADKDETILLIDGEHQVPRSEFYKMQTLAQFSGVKLTEEEIYDSLARMEIAYLEALADGVYITYEKSLDTQRVQYQQCLYFLEHQEEGPAYYEQAKQTLYEMEQISQGMGLTMDEYLEYLAKDYMKSTAVSELETRWYADYYRDGFERVTEHYASFEEYVNYQYAQAAERHTVERIELQEEKG